MGFTCAVCGRWHEEVQRDIRMTWPEPVHRLPVAERHARTDFGDSLGWYEDGDVVRHYVRGVIHIPIVGAGDAFRYGVWVEVDGPDWATVLELWNDPEGPDRGAFAGTLANELPPYAETEGLRVTLRLNRDLRLLPIVEVAERVHALGREQASGISEARAHELAGS